MATQSSQLYSYLGRAHHLSSVNVLTIAVLLRNTYHSELNGKHDKLHTSHKQVLYSWCKPSVHSIATYYDITITTSHCILPGVTTLNFRLWTFVGR